ncbi:MAG TPA: aspartate aminotransferase family protein, partial [Bordetella sp.]
MYPDTASKSYALHQRAKRSLPGGNTRTTVFMSPYPVYAARGEGCRVYDVDGNALIDCINNFTSLIHGHAHPAIVETAQRHVTQGSAFGLPTESEIALAEVLCEQVPSIEHVRFTNSGTEAVMMALKAARAYTGRPKIAKVEGAYHGSYDYAETSLDAEPANWGGDAPNSVPYAKGTPQGVLSDVVVLPFNDVARTEALLRRHGSELAGVLIDLVPNRVGLVPASPDYLAMLRRVTRELGILLIVDEVITLRLARGGAQTRLGVEADLTTVGKIMGGGFPVGGVGGRKDIMAVFDPTSGRPAVPHGGTFSANPMSMACGLRAMELLTGEAYAQLDHMGDTLRQALNQAFHNAGVAGQATGLGSLLKLHLRDQPITDYRSAYPAKAERDAMAAINVKLLNRGVLMAGYGLIALSTAMRDADIAHIAEAAHDSLREWVAERS